MKKLGTNSVSLVAKEAGQQWKKLSAAKKKPYEAAAGIHFQNPFMLCYFNLRGRWLRENPVGSTFLRGLGQGQGEIRQGPGGFQGRGRRHPETREEDSREASGLARDELRTTQFHSPQKIEHCSCTFFKKELSESMNYRTVNPL